MAWSPGLALVAAFALVLMPAVAKAQINPTLTEAERGIRDADSESAKHLRIDELSVSATVVGPTADITLELLIGSDSEDDYEAKLALALPADAVVTGYSLSVGKVLIAGQLLEQPKARNVYEDEVRAGIDPGLAEVSSGNRFTTRIYPIDSANPRHVRISFVAPFDPATGIVLPFARDAAIGKVAVDVAIYGYATAPTVSFAGKRLTLSREGASWRGTSVQQGVLRDGLVVNGGTLAGPIFTTRHAGGERFFVISDSAGTAAKPRSGRLRVYWDRSLSHGRDKLALETEVLARLVEATAPTAIDLVTFASDRPTVTTYQNFAGLRGKLSRIVYRGGTSLAGLDGLALAPAGRCVMVFDGQVTIDRGAEFAPDCSLSVLTSSSQVDGARLGRIAQRSGGKLVRANEGKAAEAAKALVSPGPGVATVRDATGRRIPFRALPAGEGRWLLVGQMPDLGGVRVRLSDGSERTYAAGDAISADAPGALWAAQQVQALGDDPSRHQAMVDFARRYHVAGPAMSLLVLESPNQYLRAQIAPPAGFSAEWMAQYREQKREHDETALGARRERFDFVLKEWTERKAWWGRRFVARRKIAPPKPDALPGSPAPPPPPALMMDAPPPPPPPSPSPSPSPSPYIGSQNSPVAVTEIANDDAANIVVTGSVRRDVPVASDARPADATEIKLDLADLTAKRPYIVALAAASPAARLTVLAQQERQYGSLPSFYLDTAEWFRLKGDVATADLLVLSALELPLSDDETRQIVAFRLERDKSYTRAVELAEQLAAANAEFRPQPARDLALALAARGQSRGPAGRADLERAFKLLADTALNPASSDFDGFEVIALMEANALIPDLKVVGGSWELDPRLVALLDTDVRIVMEWTADDADIDLWVDEPNGERVFYGAKLSSAGGQISNDMTNGYGPEEYAIRRAPAGVYGVRINGYDADRLNPNGPGHVLVRLIRNFARDSERGVLVDLDLSFQQGRDRDDEEETRPVATLRVEK